MVARTLFLISLSLLAVIPRLSGQVDFCSQPLDISGWRQEGDPSQNWVFRADGQGGRQTYNGIPMYLFSGEEYINVKISGTMEVDDYTYASWVDNDFIGFVLGAVGPNNSNGTLHQYYLIDWNGRDGNGTAGGGDVANSGINMFDVNTTLTDPLVHSAQLSSMYWGHNNWPNEFVLMQHGSNQTWAHQIVYDFEVFYTSTNVKVVISGGTFNNDTILDVDGCFRPGEFGFYNYSQASAIYGDLTIKNIADFDLSRDSICVGEEFTFSAAGCQGSGYYDNHPNISLDWLVDDSISFTGSEVDYTFEVPGTHKVRLVVGNANSCNDTTVKFIEVEGPPTMAIQDFVICPEEDSTIMIPGFASYNWYMDASGNQSSYTVSDTGTFALEIASNLGCTFSDTFHVDMDEIPTIDVGEDIELCFGSDTLITAGTNGISVRWSNGTEDPTCQVRPGQVYIAEAVNASGCSNYDTLLVSMICCDENSFEEDTVLVCEGETASNQLSGNLDNLVWLDSNLITIQDSGVVTFTGTQDGYIRVLKKKVGENAISNGDFEAGNTGFTSQYNVDCVPMMSQGAYCVGNNPNTYNGVFESMGDHTNGNGLMFVSDGSPVANRNIWCQEISITPNTNYEFSTWLATVFAPNPAQLQFSVEGNLLGQVFTAPTAQGIWQEYSAQWNSGNLEQATMCIVNQNTAGSGNDFAIDDISFRPVCIERDSFYIDVKEPTELDLGEDTAFCEGGSLQLDGVQGHEHVWSTGDTAQSINIDTSGRYSLSITNQYGCISTDSIDISIHQNPTPNLGLDTAICVGSQFLKSVNLGVDWEWNTGSQTNAITIDSSGAYWIEVTDANGCLGRDTFNVALNALPQPNMGNDTLICAYDSIELKANALGHYIWSTGDTIASIWVNNDDEYFVSVTDSNQCVNHDTIEITVPELITIELSNDTAICNGETKELQVNNGISWEWNTGENAQNIIVSEEGQYSVLATDSFGCIARDTFELRVYDLPTPDLGNDFGICADVDALVTLSDEYMNYLWNDSIAGDHEYSIRNHVSGTIKVTVTDTNGCVASDEMTLTTYPAVEIQVAERDSFCAESILQVQSQAFMGTAPYQYYWSTGSTNRNLNVSAPNEYIVQIRDVYGCVDADTIIVEELPLPEVDLGQDQYICKKENTFITDYSGYDLSEVYNWSHNELDGYEDSLIDVRERQQIILEVTDRFGCRNQDTVVVDVYDLPQPQIPSVSVCEHDITTIELPGAYTSTLWSTGAYDVSSIQYSAGEDSLVWVEVMDDNDCINRDSMIVENIEDIEISMISADSICPGDSVRIIPSITGGKGFYNFAWSDNDSILVNRFSEEGNYELIVSDKYGCEDTSRFNLTHHEVPVVNIGDAYELCMNETLSIINQGDTASNNTYTWNIDDQNRPSLVYEPYAPGVSHISLRVTSPFGCYKSDTALVESIALPYPNAGANQVVCFDSSTIVEGSILTDSSSTIMTWSNGDLSSQSSVAENGNYVFTANHRGCVQSDTVKVEFVAIPNINIGEWFTDTVYCFEELEGSITLQPYPEEPASRYTYRWLDGTYGFDREVDEEGVYTIEVSEKGCVKKGSIELRDYCEPRLAVPNAFSPNDDGLNDVFMPYSEYVSTYEMYIFNRWGEQIFSTTNPNEGWNGRHQNTGQKSQVDVYVYKIVFDTYDVDGQIETIQKVGHVTLLK